MKNVIIYIFLLHKMNGNCRNVKLLHIKLLNYKWIFFAILKIAYNFFFF